ncbi:MAG TPA: AMP-binding protein [Blastocatellia bacterium]|nr:AMP-binding protein [Blastocatellia bacterium]
MNIAELFQARVNSNPNDGTIVAFRKHGVGILPLLGMENTSAYYADKLQEAGLQPGDTVLVVHPMSVELYVALLAILRLGLTAMFIDPSAGREHLKRCCALHPPQAFIGSPKAHLLRFVAPALRRIPHKFVIGLPVPGAKVLQWIWPDWMAWLEIIGVLLYVFALKFGNLIGIRRRRILMTRGHLHPAPEFASASPEETICSLHKRQKIVPVADDHPALITFTSGSTGQPKAAVRTHGFLRAQHRVLEKSLSLTAGEIDLTTLPIFVIANLASGVLSVIPSVDLRFPGKIDPAPVVQQIQRMKPHSTAASPAFLERIADYCLRRQIQLISFQKIFTGGAPVFPRLLDKLHKVAPNARIVAVYGSTEAEPMAEIARDEMSDDDLQAMWRGRGLLTGRPVPEIQLRILRKQWGTPITELTQAEFDAACLDVNEPGEIVVTGDHVLSGYLHGQGDEETKFRVGGKVWHRTGDAGYLDTQGRLWLLGRCAAQIADARGTLYPFAVECAASHHPNVQRAALVQWQGRRVLTVELQTPDLDGLCEDLAWAGIDEIRVLKNIPVDKRHNAKVDYPALLKLLGEV